MSAEETIIYRHLAQDSEMRYETIEQSSRTTQQSLEAEIEQLRIDLDSEKQKRINAERTVQELQATLNSISTTTTNQLSSQHRA